MLRNLSEAMSTVHQALSYIEARGGSCLIVRLASWKNCMLEHGVTDRVTDSILITSAEEGGYVFGSVCLSVCLSVRRIRPTRKLVNGFGRNFL